jgi:hypothetical protein
MHIGHVIPALGAFVSGVLHMLAAARPQAAYATADTAYNTKAPSESAEFVRHLSNDLFFATMADHSAAVVSPSAGDGQRGSSP